MNTSQEQRRQNRLRRQRERYRERMARKTPEQSKPGSYVYVRVQNELLVRRSLFSDHCNIINLSQDCKPVFLWSAVGMNTAQHR